MFRLGTFTAALLVRDVAPDSSVLHYFSWLLALSVPLLAGGFLLGLVRWRLFVASGMQLLATRIRGRPGPEGLRAALAEAFDDPTLDVVYWLEEGVGWADAEGRPARLPPAGAGRCVTEVRDGDARIAAIVYDDALSDERAFVDSAVAYAELTINNHRLGLEATALLNEVQNSRARIQATADDERRRIERDLHDGAQQRLVAVRIRLELAAERVDRADHGSAELIRELGGEVDAALEEVRSLARGIYPAALADLGLVEALRSAGLQSALPATVLAAGIKVHYSREIDSAAYFCCLEAMQNAAKHGEGATAVLIDLAEDRDRLRFEIRDDGDGFDSVTAQPGVGSTSMRDRLAAVGGELAIVSAPGRGTRVIGNIPLPADARAEVDGPRLPEVSLESRPERR